jgi:CheY-like chemotaxis protein
MRQNILVVDDDKKNIFALCAVLRSRGFECIGVQSAQEAIDYLLCNRNIGMVLMDIMMPDMDGFQAIAEIKKLEDLSSIPIITITAQAMIGDREKCITAGADDYLSKPVDIDQLMVMIQQYLR